MTWLWNRTKSLSGSLLRTRSCRTVKFYFGPFMFLSMARISVPIKKRKLLKRGPSATLSTHLIKQHINHGLFISLKQSEKLLKAIKYIPIEYYFLRPLNVYLLFLSFLFCNIIERQKCIIPTAQMRSGCTDRLWMAKAHKDLKPETGSFCWLNPLARPFYPTRGCLVNVDSLLACLFICS